MQIGACVHHVRLEVEVRWLALIGEELCVAQLSAHVRETTHTNTQRTHRCLILMHSPETDRRHKSARKRTHTQHFARLLRLLRHTIAATDTRTNARDAHPLGDLSVDAHEVHEGAPARRTLPRIVKHRLRLAEGSDGMRREISVCGEAHLLVTWRVLRGRHPPLLRLGLNLGIHLRPDKPTMTIQSLCARTLPEMLRGSLCAISELFVSISSQPPHEGLPRGADSKGTANKAPI